MNDTITIKTCKCDVCGTKAPGVEYTSQFACKHCDPQGFEKVARRDADSWLAGGSFR
jgi:hypothetical protein